MSKEKIMELAMEHNNKVKRTPSKSIEKLSMEEKLNGTTGVGGVE